ncbi:uncharacterized [Tachysurus ichikawai]
MEAKKGNASSPQKYHPFLMAAEELGGWFMGEVGVLNICSGAHPPPHRHRPRLPAKLTHNHNTGFPYDSSKGSTTRRFQRRSAAR